MNHKSYVFLAAVAFFSPHASAQQVLACPTGSTYGIGSTPPGPTTADARLRMWVRELIPSGPAAGAWDFKPENFVVSGFQVTATAVGVRGCGFYYCPAPSTEFGPLAAGSYMVTVNATATNVTPNVACPPMTVPLVVLPAAVAVVAEPVPIGSRWSAILAVLLVLVGGAKLAWDRRYPLVTGNRPPR